jgi:hypothetical protein
VGAVVAQCEADECPACVVSPVRGEESPEGTGEEGGGRKKGERKERGRRQDGERKETG